MALVKDLLTKKSENKTVFTISEIAQITGISDEQKLYSALKYASQSGDLYRISRGLYSLKKNYSKQELGNKLRRPSYISLYSILQESGVIFQPYKSIYLVSNRSEKIEVDGQIYIYRKIKSEILFNTKGLVDQKNVTKAIPERAICDKIYLDGDEYFDNLRSIDWKFVKRLNKHVYESSMRISQFISKNEE